MQLNIYPEELRYRISDYDKYCPFCGNNLKIERSLPYEIIEKCNNCTNYDFHKICLCKKKTIYIKTITCIYCYNYKKNPRSILV
jgi:hypothetical protein